MYMAIAREDRFPITDILRQTPEIPANCQWAVFLRNHDELTLEMVTDGERDYLWEHYAADRRARLNLGIRRRLAPLLERDRRRIELMNGLLLSMPGTPVLYYGDEIGMGDNIHLGDRDGVRTPMQWSPDRNGGFSRADPARLVLPPIMDPLYGFQAVNVEAQAADPHSLLNWTRRMLAVRRRFIARSAAAAFACSIRATARCSRSCASSARGDTEETILCVSNLSRTAQAVELDLAAFAGRVPVDMVGGAVFPPVGQLTYLLTLPPYGFFWFLLAARRSSRHGTWRRRSRCRSSRRSWSATASSRRCSRRAASIIESEACRPICRSGAGSPPRMSGCEDVRIAYAVPAAARGRRGARRESTAELPERTEHYVAAARGRVGGRDRRPLCPSNWRSRACGAAGAWACSPTPSRWMRWRSASLAQLRDGGTLPLRGRRSCGSCHVRGSRRFDCPRRRRSAGSRPSSPTARSSSAMP